MRRITILFLALLGCSVAHGSTIYFAPSSAGSNNGTSCSNAYAWNDGTHGMSVAGQQASGGNGNTLLMCTGTYTCSGVGGTGVTFNANGSSGSNILIEPANGAVTFTCGYWGGNPTTGNNGAAFDCSGQNYITINGLNEMTIQNTQLGTGLMYTGVESTMVYFVDCSNWTVENLTVSPVYNKTSVSDANTHGSGIWEVGGTGWKILNNTVANALFGINWGWDQNNVTVSGLIQGNNVSYGCHLITGGDSGGGLAASNITVNNNVVGPGLGIWSDNGGNCHADGIGPTGAANTGSTLTNFTISNNLIHWDGCSYGFGVCTAPIFQQDTINTYIFNNIIDCSLTTDPPAGGMQLSVGANSGTSSTNLNLYNNTLIGNGSNGTAILMYAINGLTAKNNVAVGWGQVWADFSNTVFSQFGSTGNANNNDYYNIISHIANSNSTNYTWSQWQALGFDSNGSNGNPNLNSTYVPQSPSSAHLLGANLTSLSIAALDSDFYGMARPGSGNWDSGAAQQSGAPQTATPVIAPGTSVQGSSVTVTITDSTAGSVICYTLDGSTPTGNGGGTCTHGTTYTTTFSSGTPPVTVKAIGTTSGYTDSGVATATYTQPPPVVSAPCPQCLLGQAPEPPTNLRVVAIY